MLFAITVAALIALAQVAHGNPLSPIAASAPPTSGAVTTASSFPQHELGAAGAASAATAGTSPASAFAALNGDTAQQTFPATLLLCPGTGCASCFGFDLSTFPFDECFATSFSFESVAISQPSNEGLPFGVLVGPPGCASFAQIPTVNECFNVNGGPFTDFALIE